MRERERERTYDPRNRWTDPFPSLGLREATSRRRGVGSDFVTWFMARMILRDAAQIRGREVWEVGCGAGILSALSARLGARRVRALDVNPLAIELTRRTARRNGVAVEAEVGDLRGGLVGAAPADVIIADLPQKPVRGLDYPLNEDGGDEGTDLLLPFLREARTRLVRGGRLYFFLHSLPHPRAMEALHRWYRPRLRSWMTQVFAHQTLREILPELKRRREAGLCWFEDRADGRYEYPLMVFAATPR